LRQWWKFQRPADSDGIVQCYQESIHLKGGIFTRFFFPVTDSESQRLLKSGFSGLKDMLKSPALNECVRLFRDVPDEMPLASLPVDKCPLSSGWVCDGLGWPSVEQVIPVVFRIMNRKNQPEVKREVCFEDSWWEKDFRSSVGGKAPKAVEPSVVNKAKRKKASEKTPKAKESNGISGKDRDDASDAGNVDEHQMGDDSDSDGDASQKHKKQKQSPVPKEWERSPESDHSKEN